MAKVDQDKWKGGMNLWVYVLTLGAEKLHSIPSSSIHVIVNVWVGHFAAAVTVKIEKRFFFFF